MTMDHMELVEKLREKTGVTYDEAKDALERNNWDLLDALIDLERQGKIKDSRTAAYTTKNGPEASEREQGAGTKEEKNADRLTFGDVFCRFFSWIGKWIQKGNQNYLQVRRGDSTILSLSVTTFVLLLLLCFWGIVPLMIIGLFCGCHYRFQGPHLGRDNINQTMEKASDMAEDLKQEFRNGFSDTIK